ncbi:MAG TPA: hypothetical protein VGJ93_01145 [Desulfuromonadaceae bacterium]|jgi:hypothetical protein
MQASLTTIGLIVLSFVVNIPCGYLRENYKKFSLMWFLMIHISIPFIVLLRIEAGISWHVIPLTLGGAVAGQIVGGAINRRRKRHG